MHDCYAADQPTDNNKANNVSIRGPDLNNASDSVSKTTVQESTSHSPKIMGSQLKIPGHEGDKVTMVVEKSGDPIKGTGLGLPSQKKTNNGHQLLGMGGPPRGKVLHFS